MASHLKIKLNEKDNPPAISWGDLFRAYWYLLGNLKWKWLLLTLFLFAIHFYVLVPPLIIGKIVDFFTIYNSSNALWNFYIYTGILGVSFVVVSFLRISVKNVISNLQSEVMYRMKVKGFEKLLDFSLAWHLKESAGAKAQKIKNGVEAYRALTQKLDNEIMRSLASIIGIIAVFIFLRPHYVIFFVVYVVGFWILLRSFYKEIQKENDSYFSSLEEAGGSYVEGLSNILTIKTFGAGSGFKKHIALKEHATKNHELTIHKLYNNLWKCFQAFNGICYGIFLFLVGRDVVSQHISAGSLIIFYGYLQNLIGSSGDMIETYETTLNAKSGIGRMMSLFWTKVSIKAGSKKLPDDWDKISISDANFIYKNRSNAESEELKNDRVSGGIKDLSIVVPRYTKIGVVGKTGAGKSTLAKILIGLYPLSSGEYTIGGISFYELAHEEQTKQLTLVLQETEIFNLSLGDNITLMREIDADFLENALEISQLKDVVEKLPNGLETLVGEKGYHLSGGERQRVGIARAIYKNSPIIILDEATSSLDSQTEVLIQQALEKRLKDKTIISIAHRVSTLKKTDLIYVFDEGAIVEKGTFAELSIDKNSKFYELYQRQHVS